MAMKMAPRHCHPFLLPIFLIFMATPYVQTLDQPLVLHMDLLPLLFFKSTADPNNVTLHTWVGRDPCSGSWAGVRCAGGRRVSSVVLDDSTLVGPIDPLLRLSELQVLSLRRNKLTGPLPPLTNLTSPRLRLLLLSRNMLVGCVSVSLPSLISLRLDHNRFAGDLGEIRVPGLEDFNVSSNLFSGEIPTSLSGFSKSAFGGNAALCGSPLPGCAKMSDGSPAQQVSTSTGGDDRGFAKLGTVAVLAIGAGEVVMATVLLAIIVSMYTCFIKKHTSFPFPAPSGAGREVAVNRPFGTEEETKERESCGWIGKLVSFEGGEGLKLDLLLKASAEVLGKGTAGSTYKAILDDRLTVAVKRLDVRQFPCGEAAFDRQMHVVGRVRHQNVASLRAYHSAPEEKLLVYDYMANGSLHSLLQRHSARHPGTQVLDWRRRKEILMGAAEGLNAIHTYPSLRPLVHANVKPSNILIDEQGRARISDWGIMSLVVENRPLPPPRFSYSGGNNVTAPSWHGYRAPEVGAAEGGEATQASDVYSFGMVVLEVVSDREIDDEEWEEEVMEMVKIGLMCTGERPEERPRMSQVVRMINNML